MTHVFMQNTNKAAHTTYYGLVGLQHRGQEGAGMVTSYTDPETKVRGFSIRVFLFSSFDFQAHALQEVYNFTLAELSTADDNVVGVAARHIDRTS